MDLRCPRCSGDNLSRATTKALATDVPTRCDDCGYEWLRPITLSCPRCGSSDVESVGIVDSWAYDDLESAREDPNTTEWSYIDKVEYQCGACRNSWSRVHGTTPYQPD